jgi:Flp pilus assembly pilin Flp
MLKILKNLFRDEGGQDIIEYGLLAFFISIVAIGIIKLIGPLLQTIYQAVHDALV